MSKLSQVPQTLSDAITKLEAAGASKSVEIKEFVDKEIRVVKEALEDIKPMIEEAKHKAVEEAQRVKTETELKIKENPWWSVGIVGFFSFLFGFILGNSKRN